MERTDGCLTGAMRPGAGHGDTHRPRTAHPSGGLSVEPSEAAVFVCAPSS